MHQPPTWCRSSCYPARSWAFPVQLVVWLGDWLPYVGTVCNHPGLAPPKIQPLLRRAAQLLDAAAHTLQPMLPQNLIVAAPTRAAECSAVVVFLQLTSLLIPALLKAQHERRLFRLHQRQRAAAGLPLETGFHACVYAACGALPPLHTPHALLLWLALLLIAWQAALLLVLVGPV